ncbi:hypothetical protein [Verminephrobacter aporrectodeae]|nr:hypothetical protein [Verminephrobacter aporrectodeae]
MLSALLVSDMFGCSGDQRYMVDWSRWLAERDFSVDTVTVNELLPDIYPFASDATVEYKHACITQAAVSARAAAALRGRIESRSTDLLMGFSYGGYIAYGARDALAAGAVLVCLSATRLRHVLPIESPPTVHAIFGGNDPHRPGAFGGEFFTCTELPGADHEVYRDVSACAMPVARALAGRSATPGGCGKNSSAVKY